MLSYLNDKSFVELALESGSIPFIVRGTLECEDNFSFSPAVDILVSGPTFDLEVIGESTEQKKLVEIFVNELSEEVVFPGEIELPERTVEGISKALYALELWADLLCLAVGNPKIKVEVQRPVQAVITSTSKLELASFEMWEKLTASHLQLEDGERKRVASALWWYRKACSAAYYSVFDSYTAYWNCLEILCNVSGSKINKGPKVDEAIQNYLKSKKTVEAGHILECYNRFVNYSIARQMQDALRAMIGEEQAKQVIYQCFEISPKQDRLYQIRNDINHGNIHENLVRDYERVYVRGMLLSHVVMTLLYYKLGHPISIGMDINTVVVNNMLEK